MSPLRKPLTGKVTVASDELPYALSMRLSTPQRAFLQMLAEAHDVKVSQAVRLLIDAAIDEQLDPDVRTTLHAVQTFKPDPAWSHRHGGES